MELQVGVKVLLKNSEGKYLLMRRAGVYGEFSGKWDMPGGRINAGSGLSENLARELMEETGLTLAGEARIIAAQDILLPKHDRHVVRITYVGNADGNPTLSEEHTECRWFTFEELQTLTVEELDRYLKALIENGVVSEATI